MPASQSSVTTQNASPREPFFPPNFRSLLMLLLAAATFWYGARVADSAVRAERSKWPLVKEHVFVPPPNIVRWLSLDYRELSADLMWIWTIQYYTSQHIGATGDSDLRFLEDFINNIIALDPKFKRIYTWAGAAMTHVRGRATQEEFLSSLNILEQGIVHFPNDYTLLHRTGLRYYLDLHDPDKTKVKAWKRRGAELIEAAVRKPGAPPDAATLAANVLSKVGQHGRALGVLKQMLLTTDNPAAQEKILKRLSYLTDDTEIVDKLNAFRKQLNQRWQTSLPFARVGLFVILGDRPSPGIDFDRMANGHNIFGSDVSDEP